MREERLDVGRHDDRDRGADAELHAHVLGHAERAEHLVQHRHDDAAAADAEQAGEKPGDDATADDRKREPADLGEGHSKHVVAAP